MPSPLERRPLAKMESLEARTLRGASSMWAAMDRGARTRGLESAEFGRNCLLMGLMMTMNPHLMEAAVRVLASIHVADLESLERLAAAPVQHPHRTHAGAAR